MGQKVNPTGLRVKVIRGWDSVWFSERKYSTLLKEDLKIRNFLSEKVGHAGI